MYWVNATLPNTLVEKKWYLKKFSHLLNKHMGYILLQIPFIQTYFSCPISTILKSCPLHFKMLTLFFIISPYVVFLT